MMKNNFFNHLVVTLCQMLSCETLVYTPALRSKQLLLLPSILITPKLTQIILGLIFSTCLIFTLSACGSSGSDDKKPADKTLTGISVTPSSISITLGKTQTLTATATYSDNSTAVVTNNVSWSSSDNSVATVSANGVIHSMAIGNATITAILTGQTAHSAITVIDTVASNCVLGTSNIGECAL